MIDAVFGGGCMKVLTIVDEFTREARRWGRCWIISMRLCAIMQKLMKALSLTRSDGHCKRSACELRVNYGAEALRNARVLSRPTHLQSGDICTHLAGEEPAGPMRR